MIIRNLIEDFPQEIPKCPETEINIYGKLKKKQRKQGTKKQRKKKALKKLQNQKSARKIDVE